ASTATLLENIVLYVRLSFHVFENGHRKRPQPILNQLRPFNDHYVIFYVSQILPVLPCDARAAANETKPGLSAS
ncbi:MAG: hypothetical protein LUD82_10625, partial [Clostridiales bacterium]|nr:hypothetical protein [Clostridiales bacterium]